MHANLVIREWNDDDPPVIDTHIIVWSDGSWWMCGKDPIAEIGHVEYYIEMPPLPEMTAYSSIAELEQDKLVWDNGD